MDAHQFIREAIRETNRPGHGLPFREIARHGLQRINPSLYKVLNVHYTERDVSDVEVRDWIIEKWSDRDG